MASEIVRLQEKIQAEIASMNQGFSGYAAVSKHQVIAHRHDSLGGFQDKLAQVIGEEAAALYVCTEYIRIMR
jgi:hypothetical protein